VNPLRLLRAKHFDVMDSSAAVEINAKGVENRSFLRCGREPDLIVPHNRRRVAQVVYRYFPYDVLRFRPVEGKTGGIAVALAGRAAPVGPIRIVAGSGDLG